MKKHYLLLVFFVGVGGCRGQWLGNDPLSNFPLIPPAGGDSPSGQTVSITELRHKVPGKARAAFLRALKFASHHEWGKGAKELEESVAEDPDFSDAHGNLGIHYLELGRLDDAIHELRRAIELDSGCSTHHSNLAAAYVLRHNRSEAKMEAETAVALDSTNIKAQYMLGVILAQRPGDVADAEKRLSFAAREIPEAHLVLRALYRKSGDEVLAARELERYQKAISNK